MDLAPPTGTLALGFCFVAEFNSLWDTAPELIVSAMDVHDDVVRTLLDTHHGFEVKREHRGFMVAFSDPRVALLWACELQGALVDASWPDMLEYIHPETATEGKGAARYQGLRVGIGLHFGTPICTPDPLSNRMDYFGPMVNRTARIASTAHGGQTLISDAFWKSLEQDDQQGLGPRVRDLGDFNLKGLGAPEPLRMVHAVGLQGRTFPALQSADTPQTNLKRDATTFIGRDTEVDKLDTLRLPGHKPRKELGQRAARELLYDCALHELPGRLRLRQVAMLPEEHQRGRRQALGELSQARAKTLEVGVPAPALLP